MTQDDARQKLEEYRVLIDDVDRRIVALLNERTGVVENIGRVKREAQLPIYEPRREEQVFANITGANHGPLTEAAVRRIFERIIDEMRTIQRLRMVEPGGVSLPACPPEPGDPQ
jgi:chorismate mutase-like protein